MIIRVRPNVRYLNVMPPTEACVHIRVVDRIMQFQMVESGMVQLYKGERRYSTPITAGEAGIYQDGEGYYYHLDDKLANDPIIQFAIQDNLRLAS